MEYSGKPPPDDNIKSLLEKVIEKEGFTDCLIGLKSFGSKCENYTSVLYSAHVEASSKDNELDLIIKVGHESEALRMETQTPITFRNEILIYTSVLPCFEAIQESSNVDDEKKCKFPKCYAINGSTGKECIILEDLTIKGFKADKRLNTLPYNSAKVAIENLAKYHALGFVFREKYEEQYKQVVDQVQDLFGQDSKDDNFGPYLRQVLERALLSIDAEDHKARVRKAYDPIRALLKGAHKPWDNHGCVLNHGDVWGNNILFRNKNETSVESIMIDYQLAKHCSPVLDILYCIFLSTDSQLREDHFEDIKNTYYESLRNFMNDLGYDVSKFYTRDDMERDILEYAPMTLGLACIVLSLIAIEEADVTNSDATNEQNKKFATTFDKRMNEIIGDFVKYRFI